MSRTPASLVTLRRDLCSHSPALNSGEHVIATVGQIIQIGLESLGGAAGYGKPQVSSLHVEYRNSVLAMPPNPGGVLPVFLFEAVSAGEAEIRIARGDLPGFSVTIEVKPAAVPQEPEIRLDQYNMDDSGTAWTNLVNKTVQTFIPSLPKLVRVEVQLVEANPGPGGRRRYDVSSTAYGTADRR